MTTHSLENNALGPLLLARKLVTQAELDRALASQQQSSVRLEKLLVRIGAISEDSLLPVLAEYWGIKLLTEAEILAQAADIPHAIKLLGIDTAWFAEHGLLVYQSPDGTIHCGSNHPLDAFLQETIAVQAGSHAVQWHLMRARDEEWVTSLLQPVEETAAYSDEIAHLRELAEEAPIIDLVNNFFAQATDDNASDIHIEPEEHEFFVRFRIDGVLQLRANLTRDRYPAFASRIKLISGLDIAERRLPQDGRISLRVSGVDMDVRVSVLPGVHGESIVLRLLRKDRADFRIENLGLEPDHLQQFLRWAHSPHGIVLVTGPTGSGKSTTLYSALAKINDRTSKIITVEDPVEYRMLGVTQIQTQSEIGYTFARALRAILRQDPDIIMIGEIRDLETAEIAVQSALTGHLVFSTLHTNDCISAFTRLVDMGVEPFLVASAVQAVAAQRLVRQLCDGCARPTLLPAALSETVSALQQRFPSLLQGAGNWRAGVGCSACQNTGYRGRLAVYELVEMSLDLQSAIMKGLPAHELAEIARTAGYRNLREDGLIKAWRGQTSLDEVLRVTGLSNDEAG
jgi:general secretion pathway protein E